MTSLLCSCCCHHMCLSHPHRVLLYCLSVQVCRPEWSLSRRCCLLTFLYRPGAIRWCHMVPLHRHPMLADCNRLLSARATCLGICRRSAHPVMVGTDTSGSHHARAQEAGSVRQLLSGNDPFPFCSIVMLCHASVSASASALLSLCLPCFRMLFVGNFMQSSACC